MSPRSLSNSRHAIDNCTIQLHTWKPFNPLPKTLEKPETNPLQIHPSKSNKRPCISIETLDLSKLSLLEDEGSQSVKSVKSKAQWMAKKRRRRGSRSVSGRSCSIGASNGYGNGTCSDFIMTNNNAGFGTDSSGELFVNGDVNWSCDVSELNVGSNSSNLNSSNLNSSGGIGVHCYNNNGSSYHGNVDSLGNESGYGSEPGYRGDAEFGYGDEIDEEEDDTKVFFWGNRFGDARNMEIIGENTLQKTHHRCRRKKHELRMVVDAV